MTTRRDYFPVIDVYEIGPTLLGETLRVLQKEGKNREESLVFWAGRLAESQAEIHTIVVPKGSGVIKHPLFVRLTDEAMARVAGLVEPPRLVLMAQIHTHRGSAFHSDTDDFYGFRSPGFISAVIGNYGVGVPAAMEAWAVFECLNGGHFRELTPTQVSNRFRPQLSLPVSIVEAGDA
jgi:hypothetical protein